MASRRNSTREKTRASIIKQIRGRSDRWQRIEPKNRMRVSELRQSSRPGWVELLILRAYPASCLRINGKEHTVVAACGRDETGVIGIVLWNEDALRVEQGDVVRIHEGWVRTHQGRVVLSAGRYGWIEIISPSHGSDISRMSCGRAWNRPPCAP